LIPLVEYWYNTSYQSALGYSPFEVLYGHKPRHFGIQIDDSCRVQHLDAWLHERALMTDIIKQHLVRAQHRMKLQADKKRSDLSFQVGDKVFLKL
jgi:hypothetical protein